MLCIGHRGAMGHAPENTLMSVAKALELGAPWIEIDVYYVDGRLVVIHDDRLERTTNGKGRVLEQTFAHLRTLDAGNGEKIPTLEEVFDLAAARAGINIELKGPETAAPVVRLVRKTFDQDHCREKILISSFQHDQIVNVKRLADDIRTGALISGVSLSDAAFAQELGAFSVHQHIDYINAELVLDAHRRGIKVFVYTVNQPEDIRRMHIMGVDGVFTNYPDRVLKFRHDETESNGQVPYR